MPLKYVMSDKLTDPNKLIQAPIMSKAINVLGKRTWDSMVWKLHDFIEDRASKDQTYHIFAIAFGDTGQLPKAHYDYLWENAIKVYGDSNEAKRFLGTFQMYCMCLSKYNWLFIQDPEKRQKIAEGEIPDVTEYFVDITGAGYQTIQKKSKPVNANVNVKKTFSVNDLAAKFNKKI